MKKVSLVLVLLLVCSAVLFAEGSAIQPATPDPVQETGVAVEGPTAAPSLDTELGPLFQEPEAMFGCPAGTCDTNLDCWDDAYYCATGEVKTCFDSSGVANCDGWCGCC